jgi:S1-C subfamily serine protease
MMISTGDPVVDEIFNNMFPSSRQRGSLGSGVVIDGAGGLIVTNSHVVQAAEHITVQLSDKQEYPARLLGADPGNDIALLQVDSSLPQAPLGDSDGIMIAEQVIAIGNPYGFSHTVTVGVVSALHRRIRIGQDDYLSDLIQTDASINPGNSGGPMLNLAGEVIGINTAVNASAQGIGFAIPINKVKRVASLLNRGDNPPAPVWLGMLVEEGGLDTPPAAGQEASLPISRVISATPAARAGVKEGDILLALDDWPALSVADYILALKSLLPEQEVNLTLYRVQTGIFELKVKAEKFALPQAMLLFTARTGIILENKPATNGGIAIARSADRASSLGLKTGDVVLRIGDISLNRPEDLVEAMSSRQSGGQIKILLKRGRGLHWLVI